MVNVEDLHATSFRQEEHDKSSNYKKLKLRLQEEEKERNIATRKQEHELMFDFLLKHENNCMCMWVQLVVSPYIYIHD